MPIIIDLFSVSHVISLTYNKRSSSNKNSALAQPNRALFENRILTRRQLGGYVKYKEFCAVSVDNCLLTAASVDAQTGTTRQDKLYISKLEKFNSTADYIKILEESEVII